MSSVFKKRSLARTAILTFLAEQDLRQCYAYGIAKALGTSHSATYRNLELFGDEGLATPLDEFRRFPAVSERPERILWEITPAGRAQLAAWDPTTSTVVPAAQRAQV